MEVYLVRHAEAARGDPDELRALTSAGRDQARDLGERLARDGLRPAAIVSSPLLRARETAAELARALDVAAEADERLAPGATADAIRSLAADYDGAVVAVAHQPDCSLITAELTGEERPFAPAACVRVDLR